MVDLSLGGLKPLHRSLQPWNMQLVAYYPYICCILCHHKKKPCNSYCAVKKMNSLDISPFKRSSLHSTLLVHSVIILFNAIFGWDTEM